MKKISTTFVILLLIITFPTSLAQEITLADNAKQKLIEVKIDEQGRVHVTHVVEKSSTPKQIELIDGIKSNIIVQNSNGAELQHSIMGDNQAVLIFPSTEDVIVEYDLKESLELKGNTWVWVFSYSESTTFVFPDQVELIFVNERPVYVGNKEGMKCHGCQMKLMFTINEPVIFHNVKWEKNEFLVVTKSFAEINNFAFDQPSKSISFNIKSDNGFITTIIPLELLWEPYQVYLDDKKIFFNEYVNNGTHVWLSFRPDTSGQITIIGTTVIPEFPVALLILSLSIIAIIPMARKFNLR